MKGEIKSIAKGVVIFKTTYSDKDFNIKFNRVQSLHIQRKCLVILAGNRRRYGFIKTNELGYFTITDLNGNSERFKITEIISLDEIYDNFWNRFKGSFDLGVNMTKANDFKQFSLGTELSYKDKTSIITGTLDVLNTGQDNVADTKRIDANLETIRLIMEYWYLMGNVSFLSNTEQALDSRVTPSLGAGRFLFSTNKLYLGVSAGFSYNIEKYVDVTLDKTSLEAFLFFNFNIFDVKDFDLLSNLNIFPSLSEKGRVRTDFSISGKYKIIKDFYIKLQFTLNYDNQPAVNGNEIDYNFTSGVGWKFNK